MSQALVRHRDSPLYSLKDKTEDSFTQDASAMVLKSLFDPRLLPVIDRILNIPELLKLMDIVSIGENQLHHVINMTKKAVQIPEQMLNELGISQDALMTTVLFHDIGKGPEVDDSQPVNEVIRLKTPASLRRFGITEDAEFIIPLHRHVLKGVQIASLYNLPREIIEAVALHHHVKITPEVLSAVAKPLALTPFICSDILNFRPTQYAVQGSSLAQLIGILDQLCAIERKFRGKIYLSVEPGKLEDELVKDLVIGVAEHTDPRLDLLGLAITGLETVILLDLCSFGEYVLGHTEYEVQAVKKEVLNTVRSVTRAGCDHRSRDAVGLVGGDEYVIITSDTARDNIEKIITRVTVAIKSRTNFDCRVAFASGDRIPENFHKARYLVNTVKELSKKGQRL